MERCSKGQFSKFHRICYLPTEKGTENFYVLCPLFLTSTASVSTEAILYCRYASHVRLDIFALRQIRYVFALLKLDMI